VNSTSWGLSVGHVSVSSAARAEGTGALMHIIGAACAALVPIVMLLQYLGSGDDNRSTWELLERIDIVVLIFSVLAAVLLLVSLLNQRRSLGIAAAVLLAAAFGLLLAFPLDLPAQTDGISVKVGGYLGPLLALVGAGAAVYAAELVPSGAGAPPVGAGRGPDPSFTTPIGGGAPAPTGPPQAPAGGGIAPGWYDDPHGQARLRYFDGQNWTEQTSN
jgi:Protein of unknown function (DUF2510)